MRSRILRNGFLDINVFVEDAMSDFDNHFHCVLILEGDISKSSRAIRYVVANDLRVDNNAVVAEMTPKNIISDVPGDPSYEYLLSSHSACHGLSGNCGFDFDPSAIDHLELLKRCGKGSTGIVERDKAEATRAVRSRIGHDNAVDNSSILGKVGTQTGLACLPAYPAKE